MSEVEIVRGALKIQEDIGHPSVILSNANTGHDRLMREFSVDQVRKVCRDNIIAHSTMVQKFIDDITKRKHGHFVTIASVLCLSSNELVVEYICKRVGTTAGVGTRCQILTYTNFSLPKCGNVVHPNF